MNPSCWFRLCCWFRRALVLWGASCAVGLGPRLWAATYTWTGAGADSAWSTPANWFGPAPPAPPGSAEDTIVFAVTTRYRPEQDMPDIRLGRLVFDGSAAGFTLSSSSGGLIFDQRGDGTLPAIVQDSAALQTIRSFYQGPRAITLAADTTIFGSGSGGLDLQAELTGPGRLILDLPSGVLFHSTSRVNTHAGTEIRSGVLSAWADSTLGTAGAPLVLDGGALYLSSSQPGTWNRPIDVRSRGGAIMAAGQKTYNGPISGPGTLLVARNPLGGGELTLAGLNTAAGGTRIEAILRVDHDDRLGGPGAALYLSGGTLKPSAALTVNRPILVEGSGTIDTNGFAHTLGSSLGGSGTLTKTGDGSLLLAAPTDFGGTVSVERGILRPEHDQALQSATVELVATGSLDLSATTQPLVGALAGPRDLSLPDLTVRVGNNGQSTTFSGDISGPGALAKVGPGTLRLEGMNTHAQGTAVYGGWLEIADDDALGAPGAGLTLDGGTLRAAQSTTLARPISLGPVGGGLEAADGATTVTLSAPIAGNGGLTKTGPGALVLQADSTYSGGTTVGQGTLRVDRDSALGNAAGPILLDGGTLRSTASFATGRSLAAGNEGGTIDTAGNDLECAGPTTVVGELVRSGSGSLTLSGAVDLAGRLVNLEGEMVLSGSLSGEGELRQDGPGTLRFTAPGSFSGQVFVAAGAAHVEYDLAVQHASVQLAAGALLDLSGAQEPVLGTLSGWGDVQLDGIELLVGNNALPGDFRGTISGTGGLTKIGAGLVHLGGDNSYTGPTVIRQGTLSAQSDLALGAPGAALAFDGGTLLTPASFQSNRPVDTGPAGARLDVRALATLSGQISGPGALVKTGPGTLVLAGNNTYLGTTQIEQGAVQLGAAGGLPSGAHVALSAGATLDLGGFDLALADLSGPGTIETAGAGLTIDAPSPVGFTGRITGSGTLTKRGSAAVTLSAPSDYTGQTLVETGSLIVQAPLDSPTFVVNGGATLRFENVGLPAAPLRTLRAESDAAIEYHASTIPGGYLRGPGMHRVLAAGTSRFEGATAFASAQIEQQGPLELVNFLSGAQIDSAAPLVWEGGMNLSSGRLTVSSTAEMADWINDGVLSIAPGGVLDNHTSNLVSGGGSRITIEPGAVLNTDARAEGTSLELQGSLLVNNGTITGTTNVYYGATLKGTGTFGSVQVFEGGKFSPGNSAGIARIEGDLTWGSRGQLDFEIVDAAGPPGVGHDLIRLIGADSQLQVTAGSDPADAFCIHVVSGLADRPRAAANFDARRAWQWLLIEGAESSLVLERAGDGLVLEGAGDGLLFEALEDGIGFDSAGIVLDTAVGPDPTGIVLDTADFRNPLEGGRFGLAAEGGNLYLTFQPVPEPGSAALLGVLLGCVALAGVVRGRRRLSSSSNLAILDARRVRVSRDRRGQSQPDIDRRIPGT